MKRRFFALHQFFSLLKNKQLQRGDGGIYVIFILATVMLGAFALTGGLTPHLNPNPTASDQVQIDEESARRSSEQALQLIDIKIKPSPTPTPTVIPTTPAPSTPPSSPTPVACLDKTALVLVLDVSTSMRSNDKIGILNATMRNLVTRLRDETVVAAVQFAGPASFPSPNNGAATLLPFTKYGDNKSLVSSRLTQLSVHTNSANDGTYIRNAFSKTISEIAAVKQQYESQGYKFVTLFFSDGVPETQFTDNNCRVEFQNPYLCFANVQDPRSTQGRSNLTASLKSSVEKVYAVGLYTGARELQALSQARTLLSDIASQPSYATSTQNTNDLNRLFADAVSSICE